MRAMSTGTPPDAKPVTSTFDALYGRGARVFAALAVVGSFVMPPHGIGFTICLLDRYAGLPCPGCGLTRSFACISHGLLETAVGYHPFGPLLYAWAWSAVGVSLLGSARRARLADRFAANSPWTERLYLGAVVAFLMFGMARLGVRMWWRFEGISG